MRFRTHSHRNGWELLQLGDYAAEREDIIDVIGSITDDDIIRTYQLRNATTNKSVSPALNYLLRERFVRHGWRHESPIFQEPEYSQPRETVWRLDFAKGGVSLEVSYNHGEALAWNLLKPVLASELNHVEKAIQTSLGVVVLATQALKEAGGFDGSIGTFEKAIRYLRPLQNQLSIPLVLIGLEAPESFVVEHVKVDGKRLARFRQTRPPYDLITA